MKTSNRIIRPWKNVVILLFTVSALYAADHTLRYRAQPNTSKIRIDGTSTLHDWSVESPIIGGQFTASSGFAKDPSSTGDVKPSVEVKIPVRTLKSDKKAMDNVMYEAMKQKEHPNIEYRLKDMKLRGPVGGVAGAYVFETEGELTVAGVTKTESMVVLMEKLNETTLRFSGTNDLKMTDFGIKPPAPALALGLIKTGDEVKISFEWVTAQTAAE